MSDKYMIKSDDGNEYVAFTVRAKFSDEALAVHNSFRLFAKEEANDDYTLAIKRLLENWGSDWKYEALYAMILELQKELESKEKKLEKEEPKRLGMGGRLG